MWEFTNIRNTQYIDGRRRGPTGIVVSQDESFNDKAGVSDKHRQEYQNSKDRDGRRRYTMIPRGSTKTGAGGKGGSEDVGGQGASDTHQPYIRVCGLSEV